MALTDPRIIYGIHSITPYRRADSTPFGILLVLGGGNLELTGKWFAGLKLGKIGGS